MSWGSLDQGPQTRDQKSNLPSSRLEAGNPNSRCQQRLQGNTFLALPALSGPSGPSLVATSLQSVPQSAPGLSLVYF